jgi:hypothetical protein
LTRQRGKKKKCTLVLLPESFKRFAILKFSPSICFCFIQVASENQQELHQDNAVNVQAKLARIQN